MSPARTSTWGSCSLIWQSLRTSQMSHTGDPLMSHRESPLPHTCGPTNITHRVAFTSRTWTYQRHTLGTCRRHTWGPANVMYMGPRHHTRVPRCHTQGPPTSHTGSPLHIMHRPACMLFADASTHSKDVNKDRTDQLIRLTVCTSAGRCKDQMTFRDLEHLGV